MKRKIIYLIIALCLLSIGVAAKIIEIYPADARMTTIIVGGGAPAEGEAALCSAASGDPADVICEDFQSSSSCYAGKGSVCWNTFDGLVESSTGTVVFEAGGVTFSASDNDDTAEFSLDNDGSDTELYLKITFVINSHSLATGEEANLFGIDNNYVRLENDGGTLYLNFYYNSATLIAGTTAVTTGTDIVVGVYANEVTEAGQLWVNGISQGTTNASQWQAFSPLLYFGLYHPAKAINITIKDIQADDDTMP